MEEEENYLDKPASEITADILGSDIAPYVLGGGLTTGLGSVRGGSVNFDPRILGNMQTQVMKNAPGNKLGLLLNPKRAFPYAKYAMNTLPQAISKNPMSVASASVIPATAATIAYDVVEDEAQRTAKAIENLYSDAGSDMEKANAMTAEKLRKLNLIEEQRSFDQGTEPFGGEEGITMGNLDEYFAANPDFSGIGGVQVPDSGYHQGGQFLPEKPGKYSFENEIGAPGLDVYQGGVDYSSAFAGNQPTAPMSGSGGMTGFRPQFEGQTLGQYLRYEDTPEQATMQRLDPQGRLRQFTSDGQLAPQYSAYEAESQRVQDKLKNQPKRVGSASEVGTGGTAQGDLSLSDYRSILRGQGIGGSAQMALAKQMMTEAESKKSTAELNAERIRAQMAKSMQPKEPRAPTSAELGLQVGQTMAGLQAKIDAGQELTPEELQTYNGLNAYIQMQSQFGDSPFQMPENPKVLPSADDPEGEKLITEVMSRNPGKSREDVIAKLRSANKLI